jgi:hypothetical protein
MTIEQFRETTSKLDRKVKALMRSKRGIGSGGQNYARFAKSVTQQFDYFNRFYTSAVVDTNILLGYTTYMLKQAKKYLDLLTSFQSNNQIVVAVAVEPIMLAKTTLTKTIAIINAYIQTHIAKFRQMSIVTYPLIGTYMREYLAQTFPQL